MTDAIATALASVQAALNELSAAIALDHDASNDAALAQAKLLIAARRRAQGQLDGHLARGPAWDLLLVLFAADAQQSVLPLGKAFAAAGLAGATGDRAMKLLETANLAERSEQAAGRRRTIKLTSLGKAMMTCALVGPSGDEAAISERL